MTAYENMRCCSTRRVPYNRATFGILILYFSLLACLLVYLFKDDSISIEYKNVTIGNAVIIVKEEKINSIGEYGKVAEMPADMSEYDKQLSDKAYKQYGVNKFLSDLISKRRKLPNIRPDQCNEEGRYLKNLPQTDVIISFYNEAWSVLIRTITSVLERSPTGLIRNIILVDDFSDLEHLKKPLEDYWNFEPKIKIIRTTKREGLIRAKLLGFRSGTAPVATFLDAHCECANGWLEPLLDRVARNSTIVPCPTVDYINYKTFEYTHKPLTALAVGAFTWDLNFRWIYQLEYEKKRRKDIADPVRSPVMAGGLFSIDRAYFLKLGTYDDGFNIWGGENLELSWKVWMCGGTVEIVPCSRVGHIAKGFHPYNFSFVVINTNLGRVAKVWMDEFAQHFFELQNRTIAYDYGDISSRIALRKSLNCKSFAWYLDTVYPTLFRPDKLISSGELALLNRTLCLQTRIFGDYPVLAPCTGLGWNQRWVYTKRQEISRDYFKCLDSTPGSGLMMYSCQNWSSQKWTYDFDTYQFIDVRSNCLTAVLKSGSFTGGNVTVAKCDKSLDEQRWVINSIKEVSQKNVGVS